MDNEIISTKVTDYDFHIAHKDNYGVSYSDDGTKLIGIHEKKEFNCIKYQVKEGTKVICDYAFSKCPNVFRIIIPDSVEVIGVRAFSGCSSLKSIVLSNSLKTIKSFAFKDCKSLKEITLPNSLETLGEMAFSYTNIKEITLPYSLIRIEGNPITYNKVSIKSDSPYFMVEDNNLYSKGMRTIFSFQSETTSFTIPETVKEIASYAFWYSNLKNITITPNVRTIGINPFAKTTVQIKNLSPLFYLENDLLITNDKKTLICNLSKEKEIRLPSSITTISEAAFAFSIINKCILPNNLRTIKRHAFESCSQLSEINLPNKIEYIGDGAFMHCCSLEKIDIPKNIKYISNDLFCKCTSLKELKIPIGVTKIGEQAFWGCYSLNELTIPTSVIIIEKAAFRYCKKLNSVFIPQTVKRIGFYAFSDCQEITNIKKNRSSYKKYKSISLIATDIGNKERVKKMLPKYLHHIIKEQSLEDYVRSLNTLEENTEIEEVYNNESLEEVKCPRCGDWYYTSNGVCDTCGYPWNE